MTRSLDVPGASPQLQISPQPQTREPEGAPMRLYVCTTCRDATDRAEANPASASEPRAGAKLYAALLAETPCSAISIIPVECLSVCTRSCAAAFAAPGKWTYVYGSLPHETAAPALLEGARLYAQASDGLIPWKLRPAALKTGVISRVPPLPAAFGPETPGVP